MNRIGEVGVCCVKVEQVGIVAVRTQLSFQENIWADLWRDLCGEKIRPSVDSHVTESLWKQSLQLQLSLQKSCYLLKTHKRPSTPNHTVEPFHSVDTKKQQRHRCVYHSQSQTVEYFITHRLIVHAVNLSGHSNLFFSQTSVFETVLPFQVLGQYSESIKLPILALLSGRVTLWFNLHFPDD